MPKAINRVGKRYGKWVLIEKRQYSKYLAKCDCGTIREVNICNLRWGTSKSCGCMEYIGSQTTHGRSKDPVYYVWKAMKQRCRNPNSPDYKYYGAKGVSYDPSWNSFEKFIEDLGECPAGMTLDRVNPFGNYEKNNCQWVPWSVQYKNKRQHFKPT